MSKLSLIDLNNNFSITPDSQAELVDETSCRCTAGTLYVKSAGATGVAAGAGVKVVVLIDGGIATQEHKEAQLLSMAGNPVLNHLPREKPPVDTGASRTSGAATKSSLQQMLNERNSRLR